MFLLQSIFILPAITTLLQTSNRGSTPIGVILILIFLVIILYWWGVNRPSYDQIKPSYAHHPAPEGHHTDENHDRQQTIDIHPVVETVPEPETVAPAVIEPDNLKRIEGIGPKIEQILNAAGIQTFAQLASTEVSHLEKVVREDAGIRVAFPDTWPEQAQLAAAGEWEAFTKLQDELHGGRKK